MKLKKVIKNPLVIEPVVAVITNQIDLTEKGYYCSSTGQSFW